MDENFSSILAPAKNILVALPVKPDLDTVAAGLSLYLSLRENQKGVEIFCPTVMSVGFNRLVGVNFIKNEIGNRNLSISFPNYDPTQIEKVSYDIDNGQFKLTVAPKPSFIAPQKEQIAIGYSGVSADLVILVGGHEAEHFPILSTKELEGVKAVHLGIRILNVGSSQGIMSLSKPASCISEMVANLVKDNGFEMHPDIATNLVMGMEEGSVHFENSEVTPDTFETFAYLLRNGGQRLPKINPPESFPQGAIPTKPYQEKIVADPEGTAEALGVNAPADWLSQPKVYQGTSIS